MYYWTRILISRNSLMASDTYMRKLTIIGLDNGLSPGRRQAIIWTNARVLLIQTLGTSFSEILRENQTCPLKKTYLKMSSAKWRPSCLGLNVLIAKLYEHFGTHDASQCSVSVFQDQQIINQCVYN